MASPGKHRLPDWLLLAWLGVVLFLPRTWEGSSSSDSLRYMEAAREMAAGGDWVTPSLGGDPYFKKPPLFFWAMAASVSLFGDHPFSYRLVVGLAALACLLLLAGLGKQVWDQETGLFSALALGTFVLFLRVASSCRFSVPLVMLHILALRLALDRNPTMGKRLGFWAVLAAGVLLKGPIGLLPLPVVLVYALLVRDSFFIRKKSFWLAGPLLLVILAGWWGLAMWARHGEAWILGAFEELAMRFSQPKMAKAHYFTPILSFYPKKILQYGWPWLLVLPASAALFFKRRPFSRPGTGRALVLAWGGVVILEILLVRPPYTRYLVPLLAPWALAVGRTARVILPAEAGRKVRQALPMVAAALSLLLLVLPIPLKKERAGDILLFRPLVLAQTPPDEPVAFFRPGLSPRIQVWRKAMGRPPKRKEILASFFWSPRLFSLFYYHRDLHPLVTAGDIQALPPGRPFLADAKAEKTLQGIQGIEVLLEGDEFLLARRLPRPCLKEKEEGK